MLSSYNLHPCTCMHAIFPSPGLPRLPLYDAPPPPPPPPPSPLRPVNGVSPPLPEAYDVSPRPVSGVSRPSPRLLLLAGLGVISHSSSPADARWGVLLSQSDLRL